MLYRFGSPLLTISSPNYPYICRVLCSTQTLAFVRRFPNHDDKVEETALSSGYDATAQAWRKRFGVPYSVCGCAPPPSSVASKLSSIFRSKSSSSTLDNTRSDLVSIEPSEVDATHPSEHDGVVLMNHAASDKRRAQREKKSQKQREESWKATEKGGPKDQWEQQNNKQAKRQDHPAAFSAAVPYWGM